VSVTDNGINGDQIGLTINNTASSYFSASNTVLGIGNDANVQHAAVHSHLMLVPVNQSNPLQLYITQQANAAWKTNNGNYTVEVLGYFH
jgi:hypothetical protein